MIQQIKTFQSHVLAIEVIDGFSEADEKLAQKLFEQKLDSGFQQVNVLLKLDEMKIVNSSFKAIFEDILFSIRKFENMGRLAIVGKSNTLKAFVSLDNFFYKNKDKGRRELYFDVEEVEDAIAFIQEV